ncbi:MLO-like protein 3 [Sesamum alatum]|uniref:MLO-like protein n=1 Tax=Sesamum alatum TaxID=300844 RepID=A0AAE1Z332_9LAMI|nr:MLO-like protein 3 [Sesamum alatum]
MAVGGGSTSRSLQETPSWALATVCFVFIFLGIFIEHLIHLAGHWLKKHKKAALYEAIEKLKSVLMQLGFMSLILTVTQRWILKICVPNKVATSMLPCRSQAPATKTAKALEHVWISLVAGQTSIPQAQTFEDFKVSHHRRALAAAASDSLDHCGSKGKSSLMSQEGLNQLNIFIFVLAAIQILYSLVTMGLGRAKMKRWKSWEKETQTIEYMAANDPERFRFTRQTTFGRRHVSACATNPVHLWIKCFFRQFFNSVAKIDYFTLRHGFISAHLSTNHSFNFRKYIQRSLEDDFTSVIGISPLMWFIVVIFLLVDVHGWHVYLWISFLPLIIVLFVGTKLEVIVARMAMQLTNKNTVIKGAPLVQPNNNLFWFKRPQLVLTLLHFTLFMNAFEFSFFVWVTWQFGIKSCYHERVEIIVIRVVLAVMVQVLCSYITLPLYALVTQMGSEYKSAILEEQTVHAIKQWHANVKQKRKKSDQSGNNINIDQDHSSMLGSTTANSPDDHISSHRRAPSFTEFAAPSHEITEHIDDDPEDQNGST